MKKPLAFAAMAVQCYRVAAKLGNASSGHTPRHAAAWSGRTEVITALLEASQHAVKPKRTQPDSSICLLATRSRTSPTALSALVTSPLFVG